jgi:hypothetical protein
MAVPVAFPEANSTLVGQPEDRASGAVLDLPVCICHYQESATLIPLVVSKWKLTPEELAEVNRTNGEIWVRAHGTTHPPIHIGGTRPFVDG